jgi:2EXR family
MAEEKVPLPESISTVPAAQLLDTNSEEHSLPTFVLFPKLPAELRIEIWRLSTPDNRIVGIKNSGWAIDPPGSIIDEDGRSTGRWCLQTSSTDTIPTILHTNR